MATNFRGAPHPLIKEPLIFLHDRTKRITWKMAVEAFRSCGPVLSAAKLEGPGEGNIWKIRFSTVFEAEMAFTTLQGAAMDAVEPPVIFILSHSPDLAKSSPEHRLLPQFVQSDKIHHPLRTATAQQLFRWFRSAGPLASVQTDVDIGREHRTCVVEYWEEEHANHARLHCGSLTTEFKTMPAFSLRTYDPCNLYCTKLGAAFKNADFRQHFGKFGEILRGQLVKGGTPDAHGFVRFRNRLEAALAISEMNGKIVNGSAVLVRYHEPNRQANFRTPFSSRPSPIPKAKATDVQNQNVKKTPAPSGQASRRDEDKKIREEEARGRKGEEEERRKGEEEARRRKGEEETRRRKEEEEARRRKEEEEARRRKEEEEARRRREDERARRKKIEEEEDLRRKKEREEVEERARELQKQRQVASRKRQEAERSHAQLQADREIAEEENKEAGDRLATTVVELESATSVLTKAGLAVVEAQRVLEQARERRAEADQRASFAAIERVRAQNRAQEASARMQYVQGDEARARTELEEARRDEQATLKEMEGVEAETKRQQELAESIRRMRELRELEGFDRREGEEKATKDMEAASLKKQVAERLARAERERKAREEAERIERKKQAQLEQEARRQQNYEEASAEEQQRCRQRDFARWNVHRFTHLWTKKRAVDRFKSVGAEFDEIKFCDTQPLTFQSVPWPVLLSPFHLTSEDIEWSAVEEFFKAARLVAGEGEYKKMLVEAHRRFHPDKWRSRGLLKTVLDQDLQRYLERAGNIVAQAITPLWLASKAR